MRSFLTRFPSSLTGVVLLIPCLLFCLACATPFRVENLEEGMTEHYPIERNHPGLGNELIQKASGEPNPYGAVERQERLGGILEYYYRRAA